MRKLTLIAILLNLTLLCRATVVITEANYNKPIDLSENIFYYEDPTGALTFETATSQKFFRNYNQLQNNIVKIGNSKNDMWLLFEVKNTTKRIQSFFLILKNPMIEEIVLFSSTDSSYFNTGLRYPFKQRPDESKYYNFLIKIEPSQTALYCIKLSAQKHALQIPIELKNGRKYFGDSNFNQAMNGLVYALGLLTILAMLLLYISEKDKIYIGNLVLMTFILLLLLWYDLTIYKFVVPNSSHNNILIGKILFPATLTAFIYYQKHSIPPRPVKRIKADISNILLMFGILVTILSTLSFEYTVHKIILNTFIVFTAAYFVYCVATCSNKKLISYKMHIVVSGTVFVTLTYKNFIDVEFGMFVYTNEHYVKIALLALAALSLIEFGRKFIKSRAEYYEMSRNLEKSINKRTELINQQKDELSSQREELIQQKNTLQDQREELRAQKELLQLKNSELSKISQVTNMSNNRISIFKPNGEIDWFNAAFSKLINIGLEDYKAGSPVNIISVSSNPESLKLAIETCRNEKVVASYESEETLETGENVWMQTTLTPILDDQEKLLLVIAVDSDITQLKQYEKRIEQQKADAEKQRNLALCQKDEIEAKQNEIYSSIRYAKRIQTAMMPKTKQIQRDFNDSFVLFMPKDIVSGDFYWYHRIDNKYFIAAVDCTGHGVPGAFLSIIGNYLLNSIVIHNGIHRPSDILKHLNRKIKISLKSDGMHDQNNDGMDIAMAVIDKEKHVIEYAGALRPMYLFQKGNFVELKGDKIPITSNIMGASINNNYTNHETTFNAGDQFYIFSDGIIDQFGGDDGRKYLTKRFKDLLENIKDLPMKEQKDLIKKSHDEWRGKYDQVDDIMVIGIRYSTQDL
ncbi:MAG: SpoIIE family protein phosphatase [Salinivirgaceae bacterium]|nr:SpoIIE family protein phosphatase [Salinivirgaceae bacterium]